MINITMVCLLMSTEVNKHNLEQTNSNLPGSKNCGFTISCEEKKWQRYI